MSIYFNQNKLKKKLHGKIIVTVFFLKLITFIIVFLIYNITPIMLLLICKQIEVLAFNRTWKLWLPRCLSGKESACQCKRSKRRRLHPWLGKIPWSRKWQPSPVLLPGKSNGQKSLVGCSSWDRKWVGPNLATEHKHKMHLQRHRGKNHCLGWGRSPSELLKPPGR